MMVTKRQQELIIQNLGSISAEVRLRSIRQIPAIISIPKDEKIKLFTKALEDSEETIRKAASRYLAELGVDVAASTNPSPPADSSQDKPSVSGDGFLPSEVPPKCVPEVPSDVSADELLSRPPLPSLSTQAPVIPEKARHPGVFRVSTPSVDDMPPADTPMVQPVVEAPQPASCSKAKNAITVQAPTLDDPIDPSLPDLSTIKGIPELLEHVRILGKNRTPGYLSHLIQLAQHVHEEVALSALQLMLNFKDPRVPPQVLPLLAISGFSSQRRFMILKIIMETKSVLEISALENVLLAEKDVIVKSGLVKVFARISREEGVETLKICLSDPDPRVRANTVEVIEEQGINGCETQIEGLLRDPENRVKVNAAKYLVKCGHPEAFATLRQMLGSSEVWLRDSVIFALGEIGDQASLTLLKAALKDPNQGIRLSVLKALAKINNVASREVLQGAINDADNVVAQVARGLWEKIKETQARSATPDTMRQPPSPVSESTSTRVQAQQTNPAALSLPTENKFSSNASPAPKKMEIPLPSLEPSIPQINPPPSMPKAVSPKSEPVVKSVLPDASITPAPRLTPKPPEPHLPVQSLPPAPPSHMPASSSSMPPVGGIKFQKPRSADIYSKLCSANPEDNQAAIRDLPFILGDDQNILLAKAFENSDDSIRLAAAKILSRKRGPAACEFMRKLAADPSPLVSSFAQKALSIMK